MVTAAMKLKDTCSLEGSYDKSKQCIKKQRHHFADKGIVKAIVFPVVMYECESWIIKKTEHQRTDAFELWCWRLLKTPGTARRSNQSILKEICSEYSLKGLMLNLKLQYLWPPMSRLIAKYPVAGKIGGRRTRGQQRMKWLDGITFSMDMSLS